MVARLVWLGVLLGAGCREPPPSSIQETSEPPVEAMASCARTDNPLRITCSVVLPEPGPVTLALQAPAGETRRFVSGVSALEHEVLGWGLKPSTTYTWSVAGIEGSLQTGALPADLEATEIEVSGQPEGFDAVLQTLFCEGDDELVGYFAMIDGDGDIVWFETNPLPYANSFGYEWSAADHSLLSTNGAVFVELGISGEELLRLERGIDFEHKLHHDVARWGPYTYLLQEHPVGSLSVDGVYVFEGETLLGTIDLEDHFTIGGDGHNGDWAHANGLNATDSGELVMSLLVFDSVLGIDGDPASPGFLGLSWVASGSPAGLSDADYRPPPGAEQGFSGQHNASRRGDELWVFDNTGDGARSRALRMRMDHAAGELPLDAAWYLPRRCNIHGGAIPIEGGVLASCATTGDVFAFAEGSDEPQWWMRADCGGDTGSAISITRGIPVSFPRIP